MAFETVGRMEILFEALGPFVIPVAIFTIGVLFYALVAVLSRHRRRGSDDGAIDTGE